MIGKLLGYTEMRRTAQYTLLVRDTVNASAAPIGDSTEPDREVPEGPSSIQLYCFNRSGLHFQLVGHDLSNRQTVEIATCILASSNNGSRKP